MINIVICDDNELHLKTIEKLVHEGINRNENIENTIINVSIFNSSHHLIEYCDTKINEVDIIICDIELDDANGITVAKNIKRLNSNIQIIFISSYTQYFEDVYSVDHIFFLSKPINQNKFLIALNTAISKSIENKNKFIVISNKNGVYIVNLNDIYYIEAELRKTKIHTKDSVYIKYIKLHDFVNSLDQRFIICHKSFAVNMDKVIKVDKNKFILETKVQVPISQLKYGLAKRKFIEYIGSC